MKNIKVNSIDIDVGIRTSKNEYKVFLIILDKLNKNKDKLEEIYENGIKIEEQEFGILDKNDIFKVLQGLLKKTVIINYTEGEERNLISFSYISYFQRLEKTFNIFLPKVIINSFKNNTFESFISLKTFFYFRKKSLVEFFNILILNTVNTKSTELTIEELREIFDITGGSYDRFYDFERNFLLPLINKINNYSDYILSYEKIKKGENKNNKVIKIRFNLENIKIEKYKLETNYLIQILKDDIGDYLKIWNSINSSINKYGVEKTKKNIVFLKENSRSLNDDDMIEFIEGNGDNIEKLLKLSEHTLIIEKYGIYKNKEVFIKKIYDFIISLDYYYSLNFKFLNTIKTYMEDDRFCYQDNEYIILGYYSKTKGEFRIYEKIR